MLTSLHALLLQQGKDEGHTGSLSQPALGLDATAVGFGYGLRYGETEAAARFLDFGQTVEALEDAWEFGFRYTWTSIFDVDAQFPIGAGGTEGYALPFRAVLHRVVHEGQDRLFHPHGVHPAEAGRQERSIEGRVVFRGQRPGTTLETREQGPRVHGLHAERRRGRLRTGQEEQVLDHPGHRRRLPDYLTEDLLVLAVTVEFQPDLRVAPDHGERGSQLVGDLGEELGPGARGSCERLLGALAFADIARGRLEADYFIAFVEYRLREGLEPGVVSRLFADTVGYRDGPLSIERLLVGFGADALQILGMKEIIGVRAEEVFRLVAEQTPAGGADVEVASVWLVQAYEVAGLLREQAELLLVLPSRLLRQFALCNVPGDTFQGDDVPGLVVDRLVALLGPEQAAVLAVPAQHERLFRRRAHQALEQV